MWCPLKPCLTPHISSSLTICVYSPASEKGADTVCTVQAEPRFHHSPKSQKPKGCSPHPWGCSPAQSRVSRTQDQRPSTPFVRWESTAVPGAFHYPCCFPLRRGRWPPADGSRDPRARPVSWVWLNRKLENTDRAGKGKGIGQLLMRSSWRPVPPLLNFKHPWPRIPNTSSCHRTLNHAKSHLL